jgi:hypothetical protein
LEHSSGPIDVYRRRRELRHALATVEAAIAVRDDHDSGRSDTVNLEGLREDLLVALWLTETVLRKHWRYESSSRAMRAPMSQLRALDAEVERASAAA